MRLYKLILPLRSIVYLLAVVLWVVLMVSVFFLAKWFGYSGLEKIPRAFHRGLCRIFGIRVEQHGRLDLHRPMIYVGNHISYLDIFVLGGVIPGYFIAKSDVANWPVLGSLARLQNTLFFERNSKRAAEQIEIMQQHLRADGNLILFPEGTSTYGISVAPFKSSLFKAAEMDDTEVLIQPFTVSYTHCNGEPMSAQYRDYFAWYDVKPFASHFFSALGAPSARAQISYGEPVRVTDFQSRKECARHCWELSSRMLRDSLAEGDELMVA